MWKKHPSFPPIHLEGRVEQQLPSVKAFIPTIHPCRPSLDGSKVLKELLIVSFNLTDSLLILLCKRKFAVLLSWDSFLGWLSLLRCPFMFKNKHLNSQPYPQSTRLRSCALTLLPCFPLQAPWCIIYINKLDTKAVTHSVFFFLPLPLLTWILSPCSLCSSRFPATWSTVITQMWGYKYLNLPQVNMLPALCMRSRFVHPMSCLKDTGEKKQSKKKKTKHLKWQQVLWYYRAPNPSMQPFSGQQHESDSPQHPVLSSSQLSDYADVISPTFTSKELIFLLSSLVLNPRKHRKVTHLSGLWPEHHHNQQRPFYTPQSSSHFISPFPYVPPTCSCDFVQVATDFHLPNLIFQSLWGGHALACSGTWRFQPLNYDTHCS